MRYKFHHLEDYVVLNCIKKVCKGQKSLQAASEKEQEELLFQFQKELSKHILLSIEKEVGEKWRAEFRINFNSSYVLDAYLKLKFNRNNVLCVYRYSSEVSPIGSVEELLELKKELQKIGAAAHELYKEKAKEKEKKKKIDLLKKVAIVAKIKELAKTEQMAYSIDDNFQSKVKVLLRLSDTGYLEMDIPLGSFQKTLQNLSSTIQAVKHLSARHISLKIKSFEEDSDEEDDIDWEEPETES